MRAPDDIVALYRQRVKDRHPIIAQMRAIQDAYNGQMGTVATPMPRMASGDRSVVANLLQVGLDQTAERVASTTADVYYPPLRPGVQKSENKARNRRLANLGWWEMNAYGKLQRRRARWLIGYACAPVTVVPDFKRGIPEWHLRDPLGTYPAPTTNPDDANPDDCIFDFKRSYQWLQTNYPAQMAAVYKGDLRASRLRPDTPFVCVEYSDADQHALIVVGQQRGPASYADATTGFNGHAVLENVENRTGLCRAVVPGRITLDRMMGQFDGILGMYGLQSRFMALQVDAVERGIYPEPWLISEPNTTAQIVDTADAKLGKPGIVKNGKLDFVHVDPGFANPQLMSMLERGQRVGAGIPPEFGGESGSNIRTGRRGDAVISAAVDFPVQEAQDVLADAAQHENVRAVATAKAYFGDTPTSFYVSWKGSKGQVQYTPNVDFESDVNIVKYSHAGADVNSLVIAGGQRVGMGTMSKRTFQEIDPLVEDPELEHDRVIGEALEQSILQALQQQATVPVEQGGLSAVDLSFIMTEVRSNRLELADAIQKVHGRAQAAQAEAQTPPVPPGPGDAAAQPGLGSAVQPPIQSPDQTQPGEQNLSMLLAGLGRPQRYQNAVSAA